MSMVKITNLSKRYGTITAVDGFGMTAEAGEIVAVVGPDGAGKTSLFRAVCGLIDFDSGDAVIGGVSVKTDMGRIKPLLGYMPQNFSLYPDLSVEENLQFYGGLFGVPKDAYAALKDRLYRFSGLEPFGKRRAGQLSGGMKQKLALSCALIHEPKVLVLDEPTTGVDPLSRRQFWDILLSLRRDGATIIVATPYMDEVALADRAVFIHAGRKLAEGTPEQLRQRYHGAIYRLAVEPTAEQMARLACIEGAAPYRFGAEMHLYAPSEMTIGHVSARLAECGFGSVPVERIEASLEDVFIQLMSSR
jgi:ABC-2 type transport system ATP-binding protein